MIQVGPDTRIEGLDSCSGYHYNDTSILGFSHVHLSGTGIGAYGLLRFMPMIGNSSSEVKSNFSHSREVAYPGYYKVYLDTFNITAEMSATKRTAFHRYTFPKSNITKVLVDTTHAIGGEARGEVNLISENGINGYVTSNARKNHTIFFHAQFEKKFLFENTSEGAYLVYSTEENDSLQIKVGVSFVSTDQAKLNLNEENNHWNFTKVKDDALKEWNDTLNKIEVTGGTYDQRMTFYSALYHCMYHPQLFSDVNGLYLGIDGKIHNATGYNHYTVLSLWDTFRAEHPLLLLLRPDVQLDVVKTLIADFDDSRWLPQWKLANQELKVMIGTHADSIITDSYVKGITDFDVEKALYAMQKHAMITGSEESGGRKGIGHYISEGFVADDLEQWSTSRTLEFAYDDFCIAQLAENLGNTSQSNLFKGRAKYYQNVYLSGFMRGRYSNLSWVDITDYDPRECSKNYIEGNGGQWTWSVLHDIQGLINLMGGDHEFETQLDRFFTSEDMYGCISESYSENISKFNEQSHHVPYLYNYIQKPWKTQERVRYLSNSLYNASPNGLSGNDDTGQMSAWFVFSAMGFYPVTPGYPSYAIGSPIFNSTIIHLANGDFLINAINNSQLNKYIQNATLNGESWNNTWIPHSIFETTGNLTLYMGSSSSSGWGTSSNRPFSLSSVPPTPKGVNIALNKPCTADGFVYGGHPSRAVDGQTENNSKWSNTGPEPHSLTVDLKAEFLINFVIIKHAGTGRETSIKNTKDFVIQTSIDGVEWIDNLNISNNYDSITYHELETSTRYVRIWITISTHSNDTTSRIYELEVYYDPTINTMEPIITMNPPDGTIKQTTFKNLKDVKTESIYIMNGKSTSTRSKPDLELKQNYSMNFSNRTASRVAPCLSIWV